MNPVLLDLGFIKIYWYSIMILLGVFVGGSLILRECKRFKISENYVINMILLCMIFSIIGARLYYVAFNYTERDTTIRLSLDRIGIAVPYSGTMKDLWSGETTEVAGDAQELAIPAKDVRFVKFIANSK